MPSLSTTSRPSGAASHRLSSVPLAAFAAALLLLAPACNQSDRNGSGGADGPEDAGVADAGPGVDGLGTDSSLDAEVDGQTDDDGRTPSVDIGPWDVGGSNDGELPPLQLQQLTPDRGPVDGGTKFVLEGEGFTEQTAVYFGSRQAEVELLASKLVGQTPAGPRPGEVTVKAKDPETGTASLPGGFEYTTALSFDSARPDTIPTEGGFQVTLHGSGLTADTRASFDGKTALHHEFVDSETLRATAPANSAGPADLRLTNRHDTVRIRGAITYVESADLVRVRPSQGSYNGGTTVRLYGKGFQSDMTVEFGGQTASVLSVDRSGNKATVRTPSHAPGLVDVSIQRPDGGGALAEDAYFFRHPTTSFALAGVRPARGSEEGGTRVTLIGYGFDSGGLSVEFDGSPATIVSTAPGHAVVQTPPHAPETVDVRASSGTGEQSRLTDGYEYVRKLRVDRVRPESGPSAGGETVTIEGAGFNGVDRVSFGSVPASFSVRDDSTIEATTPAHAPGTYDVRVTRGENDALRRNVYTFTEDLEIFGFTPARGSVAGNTYVLVRGRGFYGDLSAAFDGTAATDVTPLDSQTLALRTPAHSPGSVDVEVSRGSQTIRAPHSFHYYDPTTRGGGTSGGPIEGSVNVSVYSRSGGPLDDAFVMLSTNPDTPYTGRTNNDGLVTLSGPDVFGKQIVTVTARHFSSATLQHVDAANITVLLTRRSRPTHPPPDAGPTGDATTADVPPRPDIPESDASSDRDGSSGPPTGGGDDDDDDSDDDSDPPDPQPLGPPVFQGDLTGLDKLGVPGPNERAVAVVYTTKETIHDRNPEPGPGNRLYEDGRYRLETRTGDLALVAVAGLYNTETGHFDARRMAVKRYQFAARGKTYERDLKLDIPLDQTLTFKIANPPFGKEGPNVNQVHPYLDFGFEGVFGRLSLARGSSRLIRAEGYPAFEDELSDLELIARGGSYTSFRNGSVGFPLSVTTKSGIGSVQSTIPMPPLLGVPVMTNPDPGYRMRNNLVEFDLTSLERADYYYAIIYDLGGTPLWEAFLPGTANSIRFPTFPDFSNLPRHRRPRPYPSGVYRIRIYGARDSATRLNSFSYQGLSPFEWSAYSINLHAIEF